MGGAGPWAWLWRLLFLPPTKAQNIIVFYSIRQLLIGESMLIGLCPRPWLVTSDKIAFQKENLTAICSDLQSPAERSRGMLRDTEEMKGG